jgi:glycosyltransferase, group 1 family
MKNKKIKVAQFIGCIQDGGAETLVKDYALLLDKEKFDVVIITRWKGIGTANYKILENSGIKMISLYPSNSIIYKVFNHIFGGIYIPHKLYKIIRKEKIKVLHGHLPCLHNISPISNKIRDLRIFYTCHNLPKLLLSGKRRKEGIAAKKLFKNNDFRVISLHDDMRKEINKMFGTDNTVVIRNGINFKRFQNVEESKDEIRKNLGIPQNAYVLGHIGRFENVQKNQSFLVDVFNEICRQKENAFLLLIGEGDSKRQIEEKLNRLGLLGKYLILSNRSDIPQLLKAMDVFVFPSRFEGLGIVLIEAQVSGLRCIVSDVVPSEAFQTELAVPISLNESAERWAEIILDDSIKGKANENIEDYDMNREIKRLEKLYLGELNE